ncbi:hypothetical protein Tco_1056355 [Tanacetum coccineum]|uniref:MAK10-like protein n=1 Tax=Tanacetum coccineum TaxID=301880 RepID=A0ABQ5H4L3_9ASTR
MGDAIPIRTIGDFSKPSHEGYRNTIKLPEGNNVDFAKPFKAISLPQDVPSTSDRRLIELKNQVQCLMEAHLAPMQSTQVNKITSSCEICNGPHDTKYCMENPKQAFVEYASSCTDEAGDARLSKFEANFKQQQSKMTNKIDMVLKAIINRIAKALPSNTVKNPKLNVNSTSPVFSARSYPTEDLNAQPKFTVQSTPSQSIKQDDDSHIEEPEVGENARTRESEVEYFDVFPTRSELAYHKENSDRGVNNFTGRIKGIHVFIGNFTYVTDFMIVEDISSIIGPRLSQVVLGKPFVEISNMTHDPPEGVVRFTNGTNEVAYKMPHKIEQYNSLSDLEKEQTKSVYLRNEEDRRRGVKLYLTRRSLEVLRKFHWTTLGGRSNQLSHVSSPLLSKPWEY